MRAAPWRRPCACGSTVTADPDDPLPGVAAHNASQPHFDYSARTSIAPRPLPVDSTAVTVSRDVSGRGAVRPVPRRRPRGRLAIR